MQAHPPAKQGWCTDCHNPHASNNKGILVARQRELCFTLPPVGRIDVRACPCSTSRSRTTTAPGATSRTARTTRRCSIKPQPALCYKCHPQIENQFAQPSHHPVGLNLHVRFVPQPACGAVPGAAERVEQRLLLRVPRGQAGGL